MKVSVYDTYVDRKDGKKMHFDILVQQGEKDVDKILNYGREYLATKQMADATLTTNESKFCHIEDAKPNVEADISSKGYSIVEMENCNN